MLKIEVLWLSHIKIWSVCFMTEFSKCSVMAGYIAEMPIMLFFACIVM